MLNQLCNQQSNHFEQRTTRFPSTSLLPSHTYTHTHTHIHTTTTTPLHVTPALTCLVLGGLGLERAHHLACMAWVHAVVARRCREQHLRQHESIACRSWLQEEWGYYVG